MTADSGLSRRSFLKYTASSLGLTVIGLQLPLANANIQTPLLEFNLLTIHKDNTLTIYNSRSEMGQGVMTSLSQLLLDELDADWAQIREVKPGWADEQRFGHQNTIGAISSLIAWRSHRQAGAKINLLLRETAAKMWDVPVDQVRTEKGKVLNTNTSVHLMFGQLVDKIDDKSLAKEVELKQPEDFTLIGKSMPRLDAEDKISGNAKFGIDQHLPGMKIAVVKRCPVFGGKLSSFDATQALKVKGVSKIFAVPTGVCIVASNYWQADKAKKLVQTQWLEGEFVKTSDKSLQASFRQHLREMGKKVTDIGTAEEQLAASDEMVETEFSFPLVAHMTMEPMNCTAWFKGESCEIWAPCQNPKDARTSAAKTLGLDRSKVKVNVTLMGGGFGRRAQDDFVIEACEIARQLPHPVKVVWSREDDIQHDYYRPANRQHLKIATKDGKVHAWQHKVAALSTSDYHFNLRDRGNDDGDWVAYGGAEKTLYQVDHFQTQVTLTKTPMPVGILRGISHGYINFAVETSIDQVAEKLNQDPLTFRLANIEEPRAIKVLKLMQQKVSEEQLTENQFIGVSFAHEKAPQGPYQYYNTAAAVVERGKNGLSVKKVILVLDHGKVINPDGMLAQAQGAVVFAMSMMFKNELKLQEGRIQQSNFHDYPVARMGEDINVVLHTIENQEWPMGMGEKLQGTIQPAIANALYRAIGKRINTIPVDLKNLEA